VISRRFLVGVSIGLLLMIVGLSIETRFPDRNGVGGHDKVSIYGVPILNRVITLANAPTHSPWPVIGAMVVGVGLGSVACGLAYHCFGGRRDALP